MIGFHIIVFSKCLIGTARHATFLIIDTEQEICDGQSIEDNNVLSLESSTIQSNQKERTNKTASWVTYTDHGDLAH